MTKVKINLWFSKYILRTWHGEAGLIHPSIMLKNTWIFLASGVEVHWIISQQNERQKQYCRGQGLQRIPSNYQIISISFY